MQWSYSTSQHTQYGVNSTPRVLCPEWQMLECSTHPLWCVLYTRCRAAHHSAECALDTAANAMHTRYIQQIQCAMPSKNLHYHSAECVLDTAANAVHTRYIHQIQCAMHLKKLPLFKSTIQATGWPFYIHPNPNMLPIFNTIFVLQVTRMKWRPKNTCESTYKIVSISRPMQL